MKEKLIEQDRQIDQILLKLEEAQLQVFDLLANAENKAISYFLKFRIITKF